MSTPTPASIASLIMSWVDDPGLSSDTVETKTAALVELYGRDMIRSSKEKSDFDRAEDAIYTALKHLYSHNLNSHDKVAGAVAALSEYVNNV